MLNNETKFYSFKRYRNMHSRNTLAKIVFCVFIRTQPNFEVLKETRSATMNIFRIFFEFFFYFLFKSFVKLELSYVFTINLFTIAENCTEM